MKVIKLIDTNLDEINKDLVNGHTVHQTLSNGNDTYLVLVKPQTITHVVGVINE